MQSFARGLVSKKKRRYKENGFDLDLSYITPRIIAMGFPSEGAEGIYRNPLSEVLRLLTKMHDNHYLVFNLCSERAYDAEKFNGQVERIPFDDHQACSLEVIQTFCLKADAWLGRHPQNVIVVHCKAGKGRSGLMICALLLFLELMPDPDTAMRFYADKRTKNGKGVTIASQRRYVRYYNDGLVHGPRPAAMLRLVQVKVTATIAVKGDVILVISSNNGTGDYNVTPVLTSTEEGSIRSLNRQMVRRTLTLDIRPVLLMGDVKVQLFDRKIAKDASLFYCWFNTGYVADGKWAVQRDEMDKPAKSLEEDLRLELSFTAPTTTAAPLEAQDSGSAQAEDRDPHRDNDSSSKRPQSGHPSPGGQTGHRWTPTSTAGRAGTGQQGQLPASPNQSSPPGSTRMPPEPAHTPRRVELERRTASLGGAMGSKSREQNVREVGGIPVLPEADPWRHPSEEAATGTSERVAAIRSAGPAAAEEMLVLKADLSSLREELKEEKRGARQREEALAARLSAVMSHAEQWEAQLRAQHDAELRHVRDVAEERERQRKGEDVRWRERENELLVALAEACDQAKTIQGELEAEVVQRTKLQEEMRLLKGKVERARARWCCPSCGAAAQGETRPQAAERPASPRRTQTLPCRPASESSADALRLSSAAWRIRAATEGLVGRAWHEPDKSASNEQVMVDLQDSVTRMQTLMRELRKEQNVNGKLNAQIQSFLTGMSSSAFTTRVSAL